MADADDIPTGTDTAAIFARIEGRLKQLGKTERGASIEADLGAYAIRNIRKGSDPRTDVLAKLAAVLHTTPQYLAFGIRGLDTPIELLRPTKLPPIASVPIIGEVAAGQWLEVDTDVDAPLYDAVPVPPDPAYPVDQQFAVVVRGTSINRVAPDGSVLGCVYKRFRQEREGDLCIVEQTRGGGQEIMRTAKRVRFVDGAFELWPDSTDPRWTKPIIVEPGNHDDGIEVNIIGVVTWVHAPIDRLDRSRRS